MSMGGRAEGLACVDPEVRTTIDVSGNFHKSCQVDVVTTINVSHHILNHSSLNTFVAFQTISLILYWESERIVLMKIWNVIMTVGLCDPLCHLLERNDFISRIYFFTFCTSSHRKLRGEQAILKNPNRL